MQMTKAEGGAKGLQKWLNRQQRRLSGKMLGIGDGANDVAMIQAADVGIGIMGKEGRQVPLFCKCSFIKPGALAEHHCRCAQYLANTVTLISLALLLRDELAQVTDQKLLTCAALLAWYAFLFNVMSRQLQHHVKSVSASPQWYSQQRRTCPSPCITVLCNTYS